MSISFNPQQCLIVVVDDDEGVLFTVENNFSELYHLKSFQKPEEALNFIENHHCDVVIADQRMPGMKGIELIKKIKEIDFDIVCMVFSAYTDIEVLKECVNSNIIFRFLEKPFDVNKMKFEIGQAIERRRLLWQNNHYRYMLELENRILREEMVAKYPVIIGEDGDLKELIERAKQAAEYDASVFITGETGTGKELMARFIHQNSPRRERPFIPVVCSAFSVGLLESELFGHEKGAFTGAHSKRRGRFEAADTGTLFLDEIGDVALDIQVKLLRALQEKEFERVGGNEKINVDVRFIAATNQNVKKMIDDGTFRNDLYYRLNVVPIELPPLRKRKNDIHLFIRYFIDYFNKKMGKKVEGVSLEAEDMIMNYEWPGNIREMANVFERAMITAKYQMLQPEDLLIERAETNVKIKNKVELNRDVIEKTLSECSGNRTHTAEALGISRQHLHRKMKEFDLK